MQRYLIQVVFFSLLMAAGLAGFNWLINPYKIWNPPTISGINSGLFQLPFKERIYKIVALLKNPKDIVILGSSRSDQGLNPKSKVLGENALNMALVAQPYEETRILYEWLLDHHPSTKTFIIGLDFFASNVYYHRPTDYDADNYSPWRSTKLLMSVSTLSDAVKTLVIRKPYGEAWTAEGLHYWFGSYLKKAGGMRKIFNKTEKDYFIDIYLPEPQCKFSFETEDKKYKPIEELRVIFEKAYRDHINLKLFISPSHARLWEVLAASDLWDKWEEWKHMLVKMNEEEAQKAGQSPFVLWDFSGYNSITTDPVPVLGDDTSLMHWYTDASHYNPIAGDLVLQRLFNTTILDQKIPEDFGVMLDSRNIDAHLARIRMERINYRQTHPEDITEIATLAIETAKGKNCKK